MTDIYSDYFSNDYCVKLDNGEIVLSWGMLLMYIECLRSYKGELNLLQGDDPLTFKIESVKGNSTTPKYKLYQGLQYGGLKYILDALNKAPKHSVSFYINALDFDNFIINAFQKLYNYSSEKDAIKIINYIYGMVNSRFGGTYGNDTITFMNKYRDYTFKQPVLVYSMADFATLINILITSKPTAAKKWEDCSTFKKSDAYNNIKCKSVNI